MKKYGKILIITTTILLSSIAYFLPKNITLPAYNEVVINITKREAESENIIELTEQEKKELYSILRDIKGIYMPNIFAGYIAHVKAGWLVT